MTESVSEGRIASRIYTLKVILRSPVSVTGRSVLLRCLTIKQKGVRSLMGTVRMSDNDRLDRMERKLNRIGKYVLFGIALFTILLAVEMQKMSSDIFFGYGRFALWLFIGIVTVMLLAARAPFRD